jgi:hypothetical protein
MKPNKKKTVIKLQKGKMRESRKEQGFFDGRFKNKVVADKKKKEEKLFCKKWKKNRGEN